jgi:hypothetical protein
VSELDDLLAELEDDETAEKIKAAFKAQEDQMAARQAKMDRDSKVTKEQAKLTQKFPRAMLAFEKGKFVLPDDPSDDALMAALKDKESELEDLGVPVPGAKAEPTPPPKAEEDSDPAEAWGKDIGSGRNEQTALGLVEKLRDTFTKGEYGSSVEAIGVIGEMLKKGHVDDYNAFIEDMHPKYPVGMGPGSQLTNLEAIPGAGQGPKPRSQGRPRKSAAKE